MIRFIYVYKQCDCEQVECAMTAFNIFHIIADYQNNRQIALQ